jgi:hypothetical protein
MYKGHYPRTKIEFINKPNSDCSKITLSIDFDRKKPQTFSKKLSDLETALKQDSKKGIMVFIKNFNYETLKIFEWLKTKFGS